MSVLSNPVSFALNGGGPLPTWSDLPQINVTTADETKKSTGKFVLDTGAQLSVISSATALALGLDKNGNGSFDEEAVAFHEVGGIGGEVVNAPVVQFDSLRIPTEQGTDLVFTNLQMAVVISIPMSPVSSHELPHQRRQRRDLSRSGRLGSGPW